MNILVTGGASGLGKAITEKLAGLKDNKIYIIYNNSINKAKFMEKKFHNIKTIKCDYRNNDEVCKLTDKILEMDLDILVNNAITGININHFHKIKISNFAESFNKNVLPVIMLTQAVIKVFRRKKFGKIINILTSYLINNPPNGLSEYVANKAYLASLSKSWAVENSKFNITSNSISPSFMLTNLTKDTDERIIEMLKEDHPLKELLTTDEVADTVLFLTNTTQQINGINLVINGASDVV